jgi:hypothetical protein
MEGVLPVTSSKGCRTTRHHHAQGGAHHTDCDRVPNDSHASPYVLSVSRTDVEESAH